MHGPRSRAVAGAQSRTCAMRPSHTWTARGGPEYLNGELELIGRDSDVAPA